MPISNLPSMPMSTLHYKGTISDSNDDSVKIASNGDFYYNQSTDSWQIYINGSPLSISNKMSLNISNKIDIEEDEFDYSQEYFN